MAKSIWESVKESIKNSNEWLFWFTALWTLVHIALFWIEFVTLGAKCIVPHEMTIIYLGFLVSYVAHKEIKKWTGKLINIDRPGELLFYAWGTTTLIIFVILSFNPLLKHQFVCPDELKHTVLGVLTIFAASCISKTFREKYNDKK